LETFFILLPAVIIHINVKYILEILSCDHNKIMIYVLFFLEYLAYDWKRCEKTQRIPEFAIQRIEKPEAVQGVPFSVFKKKCANQFFISTSVHFQLPE